MAETGCGMCKPIARQSFEAREARSGWPECDAKTVLVAEDDEWLRAIVAELLLDEGYRVLEAESGPEALRLAESGDPDAVVLDLRLPRRSGLEVLHELRAAEQTADLPVIVVSGELDFEARDRLARRTERADGVLEKPLDVGQLFTELEQAVA